MSDSTSSTANDSTPDERIAAIVSRARTSEKKLVLHNCTFCGYPVGWQFRGGALFYDNGCDCVYEGHRSVPESDLTDSLRLNQHVLIERFEQALSVAQAPERPQS